MSCQVPNFSLTSRRFLGLEQSRRGQKRTQKSNPRPRSSKPYFLILSLHSTKCWVEISHRRYQRASWEMLCCEWQQDSQQIFEDLDCAAHPMTFKLPFQTHCPSLSLPTLYAIQNATCSPNANMALTITSSNLCLLTVLSYHVQPKPSEISLCTRKLCIHVSFTVWATREAFLP